MAGRDIIVMGASTGGVDVLAEVVRGLPPGFPASIFVVCHFPATARSVLPQILSRAGRLLATHAADDQPFYPGQIYVAPPDRHLVLAPGGRMRLTRGPRENHHRPAIDPLFRSAARHYGPRTIGVVLTGALSDGTAGLLAIRDAGGLAVVQDPRDAPVAAMPVNATLIAGTDYTAPASGLAALLVDLVKRPAPAEGGAAMPDPMEQLPEHISRDMRRQVSNGRRGEVSLYACPECGGNLWQVDEQELVRFRCHVGHVYSGEVLLAEQAEALEAALWTAVRIFKEKCLLSRQLAARAQLSNDAAAATRFEEQAQLDERYAAMIEKYLLTNGGPAPADVADVPPAGPAPAPPPGGAT